MFLRLLKIQSTSLFLVLREPNVIGSKILHAEHGNQDFQGTPCPLSLMSLRVPQGSSRKLLVLFALLHWSLSMERRQQFNGGGNGCLTLGLAGNLPSFPPPPHSIPEKLLVPLCWEKCQLLFYGQGSNSFIISFPPWSTKVSLITIPAIWESQDFSVAETSKLAIINKTPRTQFQKFEVDQHVKGYSV